MTVWSIYYSDVVFVIRSQLDGVFRSGVDVFVGVYRSRVDHELFPCLGSNRGVIFASVLGAVPLSYSFALVCVQCAFRHSGLQAGALLLHLPGLYGQVRVLGHQCFWFPCWFVLHKVGLCVLHVSLFDCLSPSSYDVGKLYAVRAFPVGIAFFWVPCLFFRLDSAAGVVCSMAFGT